MRRNGRIVGGLINGRNGKINGRGGLLNARSAASSLPTYGLAAHFDAVAGITSAGGFASQWNDLSGNAHHLLQATGANQPIHLPFSGTKYGYFPGAAGNHASSPAKTISTGDMTLIYYGSLDNWQPATLNILLSKDQSAGNRDFGFYIDAAASGAKPTVYWFQADGTSKSVVATVGPTVSNSQAIYLACTIDVDNGASGHSVKFWTSPDDITWTQLGSTVTNAGVTNIRDTSAILRVGDYGATAPMAGRATRAWFYEGIPAAVGGAGGETLKADFDPSRWTSGSTFTAATGETWTINSTGSKPAQIVDRASLLFDGAAHYMKCSAFTLIQPETLYLVAKQVSWALSACITDGNAADTMLVYQNATTPKIRAFAGSASTENSNLAVGTTGVVCSVFNGASSVLRVNNTTEIAGNFGASNAGGFTFGARASGTQYANIQAYEALIYNTAHDAATRANIIRALMSKHGVA